MSQYVRIPNRLFDCAVHITPDTGKIHRKKHLPLQAVDIAVYIGLLSFQQRGKQLVVCKLATLAGRCHMSVSSLLRALGRMESKGLIRRIHRYNRHGCRASCGYVLSPVPGATAAWTSGICACRCLHGSCVYWHGSTAVPAMAGSWPIRLSAKLRPAAACRKPPCVNVSAIWRPWGCWKNRLFSQNREIMPITVSGFFRVSRVIRRLAGC